MDTQEQEVVIALIERAQAGEHLPFKLITNISEYFINRTSKRAIKSVIKSLTKSRDRVFKRYCRQVAVGEGDFEQLLICNALQDAAEFYKTEIRIITDMIDEYDEYLLTNINNLIGAILFEERPENKLWDHREQ